MKKPTKETPARIIIEGKVNIYGPWDIDADVIIKKDAMVTLHPARDYNQGVRVKGTIKAE